MTAESTGRQLIGFNEGATWDTAVALTGGVGVHGRVSYSISRNEFRTIDVGFGLKVFDMTKLDVDVGVRFNCDLFFGSHATQLIAMILGSGLVAAETTASQGDYPHTFDFEEVNDGLFTTLTASYGSRTTDVIEFPSVKWNRLKLTLNNNQIAQLEAEGVASRMVITGTVNDRDDLEALTYAETSDSDDRYVAVGSANDYFRINDASGAALDSTHNFEILTLEYEINRPMQSIKPLRGANSRYTIEPVQLDPATETLTIQFAEIDTSKYDFLAKWAADTRQKAELYVAGSQIGTGVRRSFRIQWPKLSWPGELPSGVDLPNNNTLMQPTVVLRPLSATAAPSGMTGVTDTRIVAVNGRATAYLTP